MTFSPPIEERIPQDITMLVFNKTHIRLTIFAGEKWMSDKITQPIGLKVLTVNTGPSPITMNGDGTSHGSVPGNPPVAASTWRRSAAHSVRLSSLACTAAR